MHCLGSQLCPLGAGRGLEDPKGLCPSSCPCPQRQRAQEGNGLNLDLCASRLGPRHCKYYGFPGLVPGWPLREGGQTPARINTPSDLASFLLLPHSRTSLPLTCHSPINVKVRATAGLCVWLPKSLFGGQPEGPLFPGCPNPSSVPLTSSPSYPFSSAWWHEAP